jgi:N utilization substance protein B
MRRSSREIAFQVLYQSEFAPALSVRDTAHAASEAMKSESADPETLDFARQLVDGVQAKKSDIDAKIQSASQHWKIERMASVDRNLLRLAVFEMIFAPNPLKPAIVINEAVELAKKFGSSESASFVNGLLDQIGRGL